MTLFGRCIDTLSMSLSLKSAWYMLYSQEEVVNLFWHSALWDAVALKDILQVIKDQLAALNKAELRS